MQSTAPRSSIVDDFYLLFFSALEAAQATTKRILVIQGRDRDTLSHSWRNQRLALIPRKLHLGSE